MLWRKYWNLLVRFRSLVWWKRGIDCLYETNMFWVGMFMSYEGMDHLFGRNEHAIVYSGLSIMTPVTCNMVKRWNRLNTLLCICAYQPNQKLKVLWFKLHGWIWREEIKIQSRRWVEDWEQLLRKYFLFLNNWKIGVNYLCSLKEVSLFIDVHVDRNNMNSMVRFFTWMDRQDKAQIEIHSSGKRWDFLDVMGRFSNKFHIYICLSGLSRWNAPFCTRTMVWMQYWSLEKA